MGNLAISKAGSFYIRGKNLVLTFKDKGHGYVVTALETGDFGSRFVGYVFLTTEDLANLLAR